MTSHTARLYALAVATLVFFLSWAAISARPWVSEPAAATATDTPASASELAALRARERALKKQVALARDLLGAQAVDVALPTAEAVSTPPQVISAPPATVTQSS